MKFYYIKQLFESAIVWARSKEEAIGIAGEGIPIDDEPVCTEIDIDIAVRLIREEEWDDMYDIWDIMAGIGALGFLWDTIRKQKARIVVMHTEVPF